MSIKELIKKLKKGKIKKDIYSTTNANGENVIIDCNDEKHIVVSTLQKNNWIRINEYDEEGNMIAESYDY